MFLKWIDYRFVEQISDCQGGNLVGEDRIIIYLHCGGGYMDLHR
jgi:hypothetical protein